MERSLSARRAWIEIQLLARLQNRSIYVALRKESVDRNMPRIGTLRSTHKSLSARRAWIEMLYY